MGLREEMIQVAAVAVAIVQDLDYGTTAPMLPPTKHTDPIPVNAQLRVLSDVAAERLRQEAKWGPQHHTPEEWLAILAGEVGEAARDVPMGNLAWNYARHHLIIAELNARKFLKERFGDDPSN